MCCDLANSILALLDVAVPPGTGVRAKAIEKCQMPSAQA
jgi:hypothetical protein